MTIHRACLARSQDLQDCIQDSSWYPYPVSDVLVVSDLLVASPPTSGVRGVPLLLHGSHSDRPPTQHCAALPTAAVEDDMPRYYCDYCGTYLTHDSAPGRRQHNRGRFDSARRHRARVAPSKQLVYFDGGTHQPLALVVNVGWQMYRLHLDLGSRQ